MKTVSIIAATLGDDVADVQEYRYQSTKTTRAIYAIGDFYYATGKKAPKDAVGEPWEMHDDQFFAEKNNTILWVSEAN